MNPAFVAYAENTKESELTTDGLNRYIQNSNKSFAIMAIKSKLAAIGINILNGAISAGISLLAGLIINGVVNFFDEIIVTSEEAAQAVQESKEKIDTLYDTFKTNKQLVSDTAKEFATLSQGVNQFTGKNMSLSTENYQRFLEISKQLSEAFPELTKHYDENGNVIVELTGNIDNIVASLDKLVETQQKVTNEGIIKELPTVFEGAIDNIDKYSEKIKELQNRIDAYNYNFEPIKDYSSSFVEGGQESLHLKNFSAEIGLKYVPEFSYDQDSGYFYEHFNYAEYKQKYDEIITNYEKQINDLKQKIKEENSSLRSYFYSFLTTDWDYSLLSQEMQTAIQKLINDIDWGSALYNGAKIENWSTAEEYIKENILDIFTNIPVELQNEFTKLMSSNLPVGQLVDEYVKLIDNILSQLDLEADKAKKTKEYFMSLISDDKDLLTRVRFKVGAFNLTTQSAQEYKDKNNFIDSLPSSDLELLLTLNVDKDTSTANIKAALEEAKQVANTEEINFEPIYKQLENLQSAYRTVTSAIKEYNENKYLTYDTLQSLLQLNDSYLVGLMDENGQLQLNMQSFQGLAEAKLQELSVSIMLDAINIIDSLKSEKEAADYLAQSTFDLSQAKWDDVAATLAEARANLALAKSNGEETTARETALDQIENVTRTKVELIKNTISGLKTNFKGIFGEHSSEKKKKTKFSNQIDWVANSLSNLNNQLNELKENLEDTVNFEDKSKIYKQLNSLNKQIIDATKQSTIAYENEWNKASAKISSKYRKKIMSGEEFSVETFTSEKLYNKVIEAQKTWETWQNSLKEYANALRYQEELQKKESNDIIAEKENQLSILDIELKNVSTASSKNIILDEQLRLQKEINTELKKQAKLENDTATLAKIKKEEKQQEKENEKQKRENYKTENQQVIDTYDNLLENGSLTTKEKKTINYIKKQAKDTDFKYQFQDIVDSIGEDTWSDYITSLKKQYKETKKSDKEFIEKHLEEISQYFIGNGMYDWFINYTTYQAEYARTNTEYERADFLSKVEKRDNQIKEIENSISLKGQGTVKQYEKIIGLQNKNLLLWQSQANYAEEMIKKNKGNVLEVQYWNEELQNCKDSIYEINSAIKESQRAILEIPLDDIEQRISDIEDSITVTQESISEREEIINAAIAKFDEQIEIQNNQKEIIQDQIDALQKEHDLREANLSVQKAEWELEKARNNKSVKIYKEGAGFVYESSYDEVKEKQLNYDNAVHERKVQLLEDEIKSIDLTIDSLTKQKKQWEDIIPNIERAALYNKALAFDAEYFNKVMNNDKLVLEDTINLYTILFNQKADLEKKKKPYEILRDNINDFIGLYEKGNLTYDEALSRIKNSLFYYYPEILSKYEKQEDSLNTIIKQQVLNSKTTEKSNANVSKSVANTNKEIVKSYQDLLSSLQKTFEEMNGLMNAFAQNTVQLANSIKDSISSITAMSSSINSINIDTKDKKNVIAGAIPAIINNTNNDAKNTKEKTNAIYTEIDSSIKNRLADIGAQLNATNTLSKMAVAKNTPTIYPVTNNSNSKVANVQFGDIVLNEVKNPENFASAITNLLQNTMKQELYKD